MINRVFEWHVGAMKFNSRLRAQSIGSV